MKLAYDDFADQMMVASDDDTPIGLDGWAPFTDIDKAKLRVYLESKMEREVSDRDIRDFMNTTRDLYSMDRGKLWLDPLKWDGTPRAGNFLHTYCGAPENDYTRAVSRYIWTALAGRIIEPGCKADMAPVLVSPQGWGKTRAVQAIAPRRDFFAEISLGEKEADLSRKLRGRVVCEMAELDGVNKRDIEWLKAFISRTHEMWIPKYSENVTSFARRCLLIGTCNRDDFLVDDTGNRRWLPIRLEYKNICYTADRRIRADLEQLWAEGKEMFLNFGVLFQEAEELAKGEHSRFTYDDSWTESISIWLRTPPIGLDSKVCAPAPLEREYIKLVDVLQGALKLDISHRHQGAEKRAGAILRNLGYVSVTQRLEGRVQRVWKRKDA